MAISPFAPVGPMGGQQTFDVGGNKVKITTKKTGRGYTNWYDFQQPQISTNQPAFRPPALPGVPQTPGVGSTDTAGSQQFFGPTQQFDTPTYDPQATTDLFGDFQQQREAANRANEQRYQDILGGYQQLQQDYGARTQQIGGLLPGYGEAQRERLRMAEQKESAGLMQDIISRGLYGTSAYDAQRRQMERGQQFRARGLEDRLAAEKMGVMSQLTRDELESQVPGLQFMERREDIGPNIRDLQQLAMLAGQGAAPTPDYLGALNFQQKSPIGGGEAVPQLPPPSLGAAGGPGSGRGSVSGTTVRGPSGRRGSSGVGFGSTSIIAPGRGGPSAQASGVSVPIGAGGGGTGRGGSQDRTLEGRGKDTGVTDTGGIPRLPPESGPTELPGQDTDAGTGQTPGASQAGTQQTGGVGGPGTAGGRPVDGADGLRLRRGQADESQPGAPPPESMQEQPGEGDEAESTIEQPEWAPQIPDEVWTQLRGEGEPYTGSGVYVPGIPYPVNVRGMDLETLKRASPWPGSRNSEIRLRRHLESRLRRRGETPPFSGEMGSATTY